MVFCDTSMAWVTKNLHAEVIRTCGFQEYPAILNEPSLMLVSLGGGR